eukprot:m.67374 g.67374  ORF g.67374 m.67374 type:complete len:992 (+) comp11884_c0_seq2:103-3078(+)
MEDNISNFQRVLQLATQVSAHQSPHACEELVHLLAEVPTSLISPVVIHILNAYRTVLQVDNAEEKAVLTALRGLKEVLQNDHINIPTNTYIDMVSVLCLVLDGHIAASRFRSEEVQDATVMTIEELLETLPMKSRVLLATSSEKLPVVGHAFASLLSIVDEPEHVSQSETTNVSIPNATKCRAIRAMRHLCMCLKNPGGICAVMSFLPGIVTGLTNCVHSDVRNGHMLIVEAVRTFAIAVSLAMSNDIHQNYKKSLELDQDDNTTERESKLVVDLDESWWTSTAENLASLIAIIVKTTTTHSHWRVRKEYVDFAETLLLQCTKTLPNSIPILIEGVIALLHDPYREVYENAQCLQAKVAKLDLGMRLSSIIKENYLALTMEMTRVVNDGKDSEILHVVKLLIGYTRILGFNIQQILSSAANKKRLASALLLVLEMNTTDIRLIAERYTTPFSSLLLNPTTAHKGHTSALSRGKRQTKFLRFDNPVIFDQIKTLIGLHGAFGNVSVLCDYFLTVLQHSQSHKTQAILVLGELLLGACVQARSSEGMKAMQECVAMSKLICEAILSKELMELDTYHNSDKLDKSAATVSVMIQNTQLQSVALECVGSIACGLEDAFSDLLLDVIYLLLEKLGSHTMLVSQSSLETLETICVALHVPTLSQLICSNSDYLTDTILSNLRYNISDGRATIVLRTMLQTSTSEILYLIEDSLEEIYDMLDGSFDEDTTVQLLSVLHTVVINVLEFKSKDSNFGDANSSPDTEKKPSAKSRIMSAILNRLPHYVGHDSKKCKLICLNILKDAVEIMRDEEDILLPCVHAVWPGVTQRLCDGDLPVQLAAQTAVVAMVKSAGSFMVQRVVENVIPTLSSFLPTKPPDKKEHKINKYSRQFRLNIATLDTLTNIFETLDINKGSASSVCSAASMCLHDFQPQLMREKAEDLFIAMFSVDADAVWFQLTCIMGTKSLNLPHPAFRNHRVLPKKENFTISNEKLLTIISDK